MQNYCLKFSLPKTDKQVSIEVKANDADTAELLGESIAQSMPDEKVYFDKSDCMIDTFWSCTVEPSKGS
jgi:hypothetical protein